MSSKIFDPQYWNLETVFKHTYSVPVYQRPYSWDIEQVEVLLDDLFDSYSSDDEDSGYFIGNIIIHDKGEKIKGSILKFDVIDGQQRITTFSLIILALYSLAITNGVETSDKTVQDLKNCLWKYLDRTYVKEYRTVNLNGIEKKCFSDLYDYCYSEETSNFDINEYISNYKVSNKFEKRIIDNFKFILNYFENKLKTNEEILNFSDYLLAHSQFIVIESICKENKVFSMFESINSKGKKLDEIDLIKTYIFSNLNPQTYEKYLQIWGNLIIETNDQLYDYLYNYIKAYVSFYRQNISIVNFKSICKKELLTFFNTTSLTKALEKLLEDLSKKVKYYNMLSSVNMAYDLVKNNKFRYYFKIFNDINFKHPKPLFLRTFIEYSEGIIKNKDDVIDIFVETIKFMLKFLSISNRDSKDVITMFSTIMNEIYEKGQVDKDIVIKSIVSELLKNGITNDKLKADLQAADSFEQNKKITISLLALYDSASKNEKGELKISYDQAYVILNSYSDAFSLDHLLVQTPDSNSQYFKYYKDEENNRLVLKENADFPKDIVVNGMDYDMFTKIILNKIGNLRIYYKDQNSKKSNAAISLKEYPNFYNYKNIVERGNNITNVIIDEILKSPKVDMSEIKLKSLNKSEENLPKMDKLIEYGLVSPNDELYITLSPDNSTAKLIDAKYVEYNGEKMTLNEWGCKVMGWKSIRIYAYAAIKGEIETLHHKRIAYMNDNND